jgi:hypothetical protein
LEDLISNILKSIIARTEDREWGIQLTTNYPTPDHGPNADWSYYPFIDEAANLYALSTSSANAAASVEVKRWKASQTMSCFSSKQARPVNEDRHSLTCLSDSWWFIFGLVVVIESLPTAHAPCHCVLLV